MNAWMAAARGLESTRTLRVRGARGWVRGGLTLRHARAQACTLTRPAPTTPHAGAINVPMYRLTAGNALWDNIKKVRGRGKGTQRSRSSSSSGGVREAVAVLAA